MFLVMLNMRRPEFISNIKESAAGDWWNIFKEIPRTVDGITYIMNDQEARVQGNRVKQCVTRG
jgi:uncharacterized membrane protein